MTLDTWIHLWVSSLSIFFFPLSLVGSSYSWSIYSVVATSSTLAGKLAPMFHKASRHVYALINCQSNPCISSLYFSYRLSTSANEQMPRKYRYLVCRWEFRKKFHLTSSSSDVKSWGQMHSMSNIKISLISSYSLLFFLVYLLFGLISQTTPTSCHYMLPILYSHILLFSTTYVSLFQFPQFLLRPTLPQLFISCFTEHHLLHFITSSFPNYKSF